MHLLKEHWNYIRFSQAEPQAKPNPKPKPKPKAKVIDTGPMVVGDRPSDHLLAHSTCQRFILSNSSCYTNGGGDKSTLRRSLLSTEMCCPNNQEGICHCAAAQRSEQLR